MPAVKELQPDASGRQFKVDYEGYSSEYQKLASRQDRVGSRTRLIPTWLRPFTHLHKIPVIRRIWLYLALLSAYTIGVDWYVRSHNVANLLKDGGAAGAVASLVLGLLLVFRTDSAYDRWWEGRKLWGDLINNARNMCFKLQAFVEIPQIEKRDFGKLVISFAYGLKHHLRDTVPSRPLPGVGAVADDINLPMHICGLMYERIAHWANNGKIDAYLLEVFNAHVNSFVDVCGACDRIKTSPIAISYRAFMRQGIALNLLSWPWYLTRDCAIGWSLLPILIGAYFLIGIELIAEDIEEPFGPDDDDLPLDDLCVKLKETVSHLLEVADQQKFTTSVEKPRVDLLRD
ncbi:MAG TPA: bestrophin family ion channel [Candidatus Obscuribacterales bacterium]